LFQKYKPEKKGGSEKSWSSNNINENTSGNRRLTQVAKSYNTASFTLSHVFQDTPSVRAARDRLVFIRESVPRLSNLNHSWADQVLSRLNR